MNIRIKFKKYFFQEMPDCATSEEWSKWKHKAKKNKIRWFLSDTLPYLFLGKFIWPIENARDWIRYRTLKRYNLIKISSLKPDYYEVETRMFHGMFSLLEDFVEIEKAWHHFVCENRKENLWKKLKNKILPFKRNRELGLKHLDWEISLSNPNSPDYDSHVHDDKTMKYEDTQSYGAKEIKELYLWWKDIYPKRVDPLYIEGPHGSWSEYCTHMNKKYPDNFHPRAKTKKEKEWSKSSSKIMYKYEKTYYEEDEKMLIRLIKIRNALWT